MSESYHVRVAKDDMVFSAAHFITYDGNTCEPLHGHNYRVAAEIQGPLDENHYVVDFVVLHEVLREIVGVLDHRMLLPTEHPQIRVTAHQQSVEVTFHERRWIFPRADCVLLPVPNTTTELLARYLGKQLLDKVQGRTGTRPRVVCIQVDESEGHSAVCELRDE